jgi:hypothetical protein
MKDQKNILLKKIKFLLEQEEKPTESGPNTPESPLLLREPKARARPAADSVDDQIDALLLRYESSSIRKGDSINESLKKLNLRFLLEQEEPPEEPAEDSEEPAAEEPPAEEPVEDSEEPDPSGSDDMSVTSPAPRQKVPDLDIDKFTSRVVRLMNNYESLLNIEESIINRAKSFLDENYGEAFVYEFVNNLSNQYGLETAEFGNIPDVSDDTFAVGAFAGGTGGLGGG